MTEQTRGTNVINALKRLERAGSEHSRTTEKLVQAADQLADYVIGQLPREDCDLPGGWRFDYCSQSLVCAYYQADTDDTSVGNGYANRWGALWFAQAIARGWLEELSSWLEARAAEDEAAAETIEQAERG